MSLSNSDELFEDKIFDWDKYLAVRNAKKVSEDFFYHICESEMNGIKLGSIVEIENEDKSGYWFASICSFKGDSINLHYFGDDNDKHNFWLEVRSSHIHSLNWGSENNKKLIPPHPNMPTCLNLENIKKKVQDSKHIVSNAVLQMKGAPIYNIFKRNMFVEVQDKKYPYHVWISKVLKNVGGRLFLQMLGINSPEKKPFWLFFLNERVFPLGWAEDKGLPWRVLNLGVNLENSIDSSVLLNVLKRNTPEPHSYKVGEMLEVINPYSLMIFYVATIVKIYDNHYFKVEADNEIDVDKRISFVATKENPYLFNSGWASKHNFLLKPPSDWKKTNKFSWSDYILTKNTKLASVDNTYRKKINNIHIGMKLEAVDPLNTNSIRVATIKGFADHCMLLSFDRTNCRQELLHLRSVYSDEVFPVGWCNKHKYSLSVPKLPYKDSNDFEHCYYSSDVDIDLSQSDQDNLTKYPHYLKGEIYYHFSKKDDLSVDDALEEPLKNINNEVCKEKKSISSKTVNKKIEQILNVEVEAPELDEEFHDALFLDDKIDNIQENIYSVQEKMNTAKDVNSMKYREVNNFDTTIENAVNNTIHKNNYKICIYFNKDCYSGERVLKNRIQKLQNSIGPGFVSPTVQLAIIMLINLYYFPLKELKKIKKSESMLIERFSGVKMLIRPESRSNNFEYLFIPKSKKVAKKYCSALCKLFGMCEFFMTTEDKKCPHNCNLKKDETLQLIRTMETIHINMTQIEEQFVVYDSWKSTFENFYRQDPRFKNLKINIGYFKHIVVTTNPRNWSPKDVYLYLINDKRCKNIALKLFNRKFSGIEFMLINEELLTYLRCPINLSIRMMCHIVEVKSIFLTKYCDEE